MMEHNIYVIGSNFHERVEIPEGSKYLYMEYNKDTQKVDLLFIAPIEEEDAPPPLDRP